MTNGDIAQHSDFARLGYKVDGEDVKVGVISDSYNTLSGSPATTDVLNGDLPGTGNPDYSNPVQIVENPSGRRSDEGRAMLQIVHDIAPKASLAFRTGFVSAGDFAQGIRQLQQDNCSVIVDDVTYITEPFFEDGVVAKAVDDVTAQGVSYFSAAGNYGHKSSKHFPSGSASCTSCRISAVIFNGAGDIYQRISLVPGTYTIVLQWQDSIYSLGQTSTGTTNDLDIFLTDDNGKTLFGFNRNNIGGDPLEVLPFTVTQNATTNVLIVAPPG